MIACDVCRKEDVEDAEGFDRARFVFGDGSEISLSQCCDDCHQTLKTELADFRAKVHKRAGRKERKFMNGVVDRLRGVEEKDDGEKEEGGKSDPEEATVVPVGSETVLKEAPGAECDDSPDGDGVCGDGVVEAPEFE